MAGAASACVARWFFAVCAIDLSRAPLKTHCMQLSSITVRLWMRRVAWVLAGVAALWALAWAAVPPLLKSQIQKIASEQLGRSVSIGKIDFKPWSLELTLDDLAIARRDGTSPQLQIKRIYLDAEIESLLRLAPVVETLVVQGPQLVLTHLGAGKYDIDDILLRLARPGADAKSSDEPLRFALFNLSLSGGALDFEDRAVNKTHVLRDLNLSVPFLSNLESRREIKVEPRLAFSFNGSRFDSTAQATPFASSRKTDATVSLRGMDLAPYLPYIPSSVPVRLQQAVLAADIRVAFEQTTKPVVRLSGGLELAGVKIADGAARDLLAIDGLKLAFDDVRPLEQVARFSLIELIAPQLAVRRDASGRINLDLASASVPAPAVAAAPAASAPGPAAPDHPGGWKLEVARLAVTRGTASWSDAAVSPQAELLARELSIEARGIVWPITQAAEFQGNALLAGKTDAPAARMAWSGSATDQLASVKVSLDAVPLGLAAPYLAQFLEPSLRGSLSSEFELQWKAPDLQLALGALTLIDLGLVRPSAAGKSDAAAIKKITLSQTQVDLARHSVLVGKLVIEQPRMAVARNAQKRWMFEDWIKTPAAGRGAKMPGLASAAAAKPGRGPAPANLPAAPWAVVVNELALEGGSIRFDDASMAKPVSFELSALKLLVKNARLDGNQASPVQLSARIRGAGGEPGQFDYRGSVQLQPMVAQGSVVATHIPVHLFEPYFGGGLNIELLRADVGFKGDMRYAALAGGPSVKFSGDSVLEEFRANSLAANGGGLQIAEELLSWKALSLRGVDVALAPGSATTVAVKETTLSDFFARVIVHENGRINLQNLVQSAVPDIGAGPVLVASAPVAVSSTVARPEAANATAPTGPAVPVVASVPGSGLDPVVTIGPVSLINGKVFFSDRFVKPNYSANLSELSGKLSAFSSVAPQGQPQLADLELRGRAESTASLEILGKLNPLAKPLALDIKGVVRDLELSPLSPYSIKYAGYGIERGKLSVDVAYLILPNGQLTASNKLVLNQLTFGDKVEGAPASLPVKLAVALLADRNGVIDINLPVSGSLNDPQFSLGPVIFKVIVNLIVKAITAPFSLLASAFGGGGDELSVVVFAPGSAALLPDARLGLDKVAQALAQRPALKMTVVGTSSLEAERDAYKRERLISLLQAEKRRSLVTSGSSTGAQAATVPLPVSQEEMLGLLKEVYRRADIPKPRNLAGLAKDLTGPEMEALLLANIPVAEEAMRELALQRGVVVKDYLSSRQLPVERLFLGAVKPAVADPQWTPRAELSLANK